ncbi:MAG TPA: hypothetical protein VMC10_15530 [Stellaceae bacterium]|nr:hypothetical protein [Stellaceae bacterium]
MLPTTSLRHRPSELGDPLQERQLLDLLRRLQKHRHGRRAVHIHLSKLRAYNLRGEQVRIAVHFFESLVLHVGGALFPLANADLVYVWKSAKLEAIDEAVMRLRTLFSEDPLAQGDEDYQRARFCTWYDLETQYQEIFAVAQRLHEVELKRTRRLATLAEAANKASAPVKLQPVSADRMCQLVDNIAHADLSSMMRRQPICAITRDAPPKVMFRELYISIEDLRDSVIPGYDIAGDRWLFQHLTKTLDDRMLQLLIKNDDSEISRTFSVNFNVGTLLSERFIDFDRRLRAATRCTVIFELQVLDILSDLRAYYFARDFVRERGYRICLDGVTDMMLPSIDLDRFGVDFLKLIWSAETLSSAHEDRLAELRLAVKRLGCARTILARCDSAEAVSIGQSLGINLFQGRYIDELPGVYDSGFAAVRKLALRSAAEAAANAAERARLRDLRNQPAYV